MKKCLISIVIRKMLIRTIMRWHLTLNNTWDIRKGKQQVFKNLFIYFSWRIITLQYCDGFAMLQYESAIGIHVSPPSWTLLPPPSPPHPSRLSQSTGFGYPSSYFKLPWSSILHMVKYMFQCFLSNHPTLSFSHWVQKAVLYMCVSFAALHVGLLRPAF